MKLLLLGLLLLFVLGGHAPRKASRQFRQSNRIQQAQWDTPVQQNQAYSAIEAFSKKG